MLSRFWYLSVNSPDLFFELFFDINIIFIIIFIYVTELGLGLALINPNSKNKSGELTDKYQKT